MDTIWEKRWDDNQIIDGFKRFFAEKGHYPTAYEIDDYQHLPSARQLQRRGGLQVWRAKAGILELHQGKGGNRSRLALQINQRGIITEKEVRTVLQTKFGEICVHDQKLTYEDSKNRFDFVVYHTTGRFGIDIFFSSDARNVNKIINLKIEKYLKTRIPIYFLEMNEAIEQTKLDALLKNRKNKLSQNIKTISWTAFKKELDQYHRLKIVGECAAHFI